MARRSVRRELQRPLVERQSLRRELQRPLVERQSLRRELQRRLVHTRMRRLHLTWSLRPAGCPGATPRTTPQPC